MLSKGNLKNVLIVLIGLLIFTQALILIHNSNFEKNEYDRICNSLYDTRIMIDLCYYPYNAEIKTFELVRSFEVAGIVASFSLIVISSRRFSRHLHT